MPFSPQKNLNPIALACAAACMLALSAAEAQEVDGDAANEPAAAAQAEIPWDTNCAQTSRQDEPDCEMSQMVIVPQSRQVLLRLEVQVPADQSGSRMMLQMPHGIYLPEGLTLEIDQQAWQETGLQTCDGNGCYAALQLDGDALRRLQEGTQLTVSFHSLSREVVSVPVDLNGFTEAYNRIR
jgi:invasion protein IalB